MALFLSIKKVNVDKDMYCYRGTRMECLKGAKGQEIFPAGLFKSITIRSWTKERCVPISVPVLDLVVR